MESTIQKATIQVPKVTGYLMFQFDEHNDPQTISEIKDFGIAFFILQQNRPHTSGLLSNNNTSISFKSKEGEVFKFFIEDIISEANSRDNIFLENNLIEHESESQVTGNLMFQFDDEKPQMLATIKDFSEVIFEFKQNKPNRWGESNNNDSTICFTSESGKTFRIFVEEAFDKITETEDLCLNRNILDGNLEKVIANLQNIIDTKTKAGYTNIRFSTWHDNDNFLIDLYGDRQETDAEYEDRISFIRSSRIFSLKTSKLSAGIKNIKLH